LLRFVKFPLLFLRNRSQAAESRIITFVKVTNNPDPVPTVRRPERMSAHHERRAGVAKVFHRSGDGVRPASAQLRNILKYAPAGKELGADAAHFPPQPAALAFEALASGRCAADILAGAAPGDDVDPA
jgi:hypothetical protein